MSDSISEPGAESGEFRVVSATPMGWPDGCHVAGAALGVIGLFQALAATLSQVLSLRSSGGLGGVGQVQLSGFYGLTVLAAGLLISAPSVAPRMSARTRGRFFAVAATAAVFIAAIQLVEIYGWLTSTATPFYQRALGALVVLGDLAITGVAAWVIVQGHQRAAADTETPERGFLAAAVVLGCLFAILIQLGSTVGLASPAPQAPVIPQGAGGRVETTAGVNL